MSDVRIGNWQALARPYFQVQEGWRALALSLDGELNLDSAKVKNVGEKVPLQKAQHRCIELTPTR
jgi:hypothetical protein